MEIYFTIVDLKLLTVITADCDKVQDFK